MPTLSVVIPVYNEKDTIRKVLDLVRKKAEEIIVVDDGSNDGTREILPHLYSDSFEIEAELTARVAQGKWRIYEGPISY